MITDRRLPTHAVCLDMRDAYAAAEHAVRRALDEAPPDERRFLVIDDAERLADHQLLYEQLFSYGPARTICLAVGAPPSRTLSRPLSLRPPVAGVLWILDALGGSGGSGRDNDEDDVEASLRPLAELLAEPVVFDAVLRALGQITAGVAVPAVHVLEHDLTDAARSRAWRQTLENLVGQEVPAPALIGAGPSAGRAGSEEALPPALAPLLGDAIPKSAADRAWLLYGGPAEAHHRAAGAVLRDVQSDYAQVRSWAGLFGSARRRPDVPGGLQDLAAALESYRETVAGAFTDGDGVRLLPEQRSRLHKRGIDLPDIPEMSRENVGPGLRDYTERLIGRRLPLRSVAARLGALADVTAPAGSASRLARLDEICPGDYLRHLVTPLPFMVRAPQYAYALLAFLVACVAGLWPGVGWATGPLTGLAAGASAALMMRRRPNRTPDGRLDGGGRTHTGTRLLAGVAGGVGGALAGQALGPPAWAGPAALVPAVAALVWLTVQDWTAAVDAWWTETDAEHAAQVVSETDALLAETAVHDWLFADARYHCSGGARAVSVLLRSLADCAETYGATGAESPARTTSAPPPTPDEAAGDSWSWDNWGDSADTDEWPPTRPNSTHSATTQDPNLNDLFGPPNPRDESHRDDHPQDNAFRNDPFREGSTRQDHTHDAGARDDRFPDAGTHNGRFADDRARDGRFRHGGPGDDRARDDGYSDSRFADGRVSDDRFADGRGRDDGFVGGRGGEGRFWDGGPGDDRAREDGGSDSRFADGRAGDDRLADGRGRDDGFVGGRGRDGSFVDHAARDGRVGDRGRPRGVSGSVSGPDGDTSFGSGKSAGADGPPWLRRETGDGGAALVDTLVGDLTDGVSVLLAPCWATLEADPAAAARTPLDEGMTALLDEEHARLLRDAAASPPAYARAPEARPGAALLLGVSTERVGQLLGPGSTAEEEALRLCAAAHRLMLSQDPGAVRQVRFAPETMRRGAEQDTDQNDAWRDTGDDVVWAPNGRHAGILRLVPLRSEIVRTFRSYEGPGRPEMEGGGAP